MKTVSRIFDYIFDVLLFISELEERVSKMRDSVHITKLGPMISNLLLCETNKDLSNIISVFQLH